MENTENQQELNSSAAKVYELPGETAIVINGVPEIPGDCDGGGGASPLLKASSSVETNLNSSLGEWFVGREIRKLFIGKNYLGKVTEYDKESGRYTVLYEDGDEKDLDWKELEEVLLPLDVKISLKTLTQRFIRKSKKPIGKSGKNEAGSQNPKIKKTKTKGN